MNIATEEAERLAERLANDADAPKAARYQPYTDHAMRNASAALRSLAAERDALKAENEVMQAALRRINSSITPPGEIALNAENEKLRAALRAIAEDCEADYPPSHGAIKYAARAALGEKE